MNYKQIKENWDKFREREGKHKNPVNEFIEFFSPTVLSGPGGTKFTGDDAIQFRDDALSRARGVSGKISQAKKNGIQFALMLKDEKDPEYLKLAKIVDEVIKYLKDNESARSKKFLLDFHNSFVDTYKTKVLKMPLDKNPGIPAGAKKHIKKIKDFISNKFPDAIPDLKLEDL